MKLKQICICCAMVPLLFCSVGCMITTIKLHEYHKACRYSRPYETYRVFDCNYAGIYTHDGMQFYRYEVINFYRWKRSEPSYWAPRVITCLIPVDPNDNNAQLIPNPDGNFIRTNCKGVFIIAERQMDIDKDELNTIFEKMAPMSDQQPYLIVVKATSSGKGSIIQLMKKEPGDTGGNLVVQRECVIAERFNQAAWWSPLIPIGYLVTVPVDILTGPFVFVWIVHKVSHIR